MLQLPLNTNHAINLTSVEGKLARMVLDIMANDHFLLAANPNTLNFLSLYRNGSSDSISRETVSVQARKTSFLSNKQNLANILEVARSSAFTVRVALGLLFRIEDYLHGSDCGWPGHLNFWLIVKEEFEQSGFTSELEHINQHFPRYNLAEYVSARRGDAIRLFSNLSFPQPDEELLYAGYEPFPGDVEDNIRAGSLAGIDELVITHVDTKHMRPKTLALLMPVIFLSFESLEDLSPSRIGFAVDAFCWEDGRRKTSEYWDRIQNFRDTLTDDQATFVRRWFEIFLGMRRCLLESGPYDFESTFTCYKDIWGGTEDYNSEDDKL